MELKDYQTKGTAADLQVGDFIDLLGGDKATRLTRVEASVASVQRVGSKVVLKLRYGTFRVPATCPAIFRRES